MEKDVHELFLGTDWTLQQIADHLRITYKKVWGIVARSFTVEERKGRKVQSYSRSKMGELNPMHGKTGAAHHNYCGVIEDGHGYLMVLKPDWYTGRKGSNHVFQHTVVTCEALGLTELPQGFIVHHIDGDKKNNELSNLSLMTIAAHARTHHLERATTSRLAA